MNTIENPKRVSLASYLFMVQLDYIGVVEELGFSLWNVSLEGNWSGCTCFIYIMWRKC